MMLNVHTHTLTRHTKARSRFKVVQRFIHAITRLLCSFFIRFCRRHVIHCFWFNWNRYSESIFCLLTSRCRSIEFFLPSMIWHLLLNAFRNFYLYRVYVFVCVTEHHQQMLPTIEFSRFIFPISIFSTLFYFSLDIFLPLLPLRKSFFFPYFIFEWWMWFGFGKTDSDR